MNKQNEELWRDVAEELKKAANASTGVKLKTIPPGYFNLETDSAFIRIEKENGKCHVRTADFNGTKLWFHYETNDGDKIIDALTESEKTELRKSFGIIF